MRTRPVLHQLPQHVAALHAAHRFQVGPRDRLAVGDDGQRLAQGRRQPGVGRRSPQPRQPRVELRSRQQLPTTRQLLHLESRAVLVVQRLQPRRQPPRLGRVGQPGDRGQPPGRQRLVRRHQRRFDHRQPEVAAERRLAGLFRRPRRRGGDGSAVGDGSAAGGREGGRAGGDRVARASSFPRSPVLPRSSQAELGNEEREGQDRRLSHSLVSIPRGETPWDRPNLAGLRGASFLAPEGRRSIARGETHWYRYKSARLLRLSPRRGGGS